jgi:hypothetical protein
VDRAAWLGSMVVRSSVEKMARRHRVGTRCVGGRARRCLPAVAEEDKPDEAVLEGCSPKHERRRRGGVTEVKNGGDLSSTQGQRKV